ncbi:hypothetical protein E4H12_10840 [Candidatus Thorarchaeota archaeon]|nr:MAG: hypothetical protein E4H12_10840 [Candidatus Thorarchaeota archaeon]
MFNAYKTMKHTPPRYFGYKGGYDSLTYCPQCNRVALYEDMHPAGPCSRCGGKIIDGNLKGKWERYTGGWFRKETGAWRFTSQTVHAIDNSFDVMQEAREARLRAKPSDTLSKFDFYDLDFTKEER